MGTKGDRRSMGTKCAQQKISSLCTPTQSNPSPKTHPNPQASPHPTPTPTPSPNSNPNPSPHPNPNPSPSSNPRLGSDLLWGSEMESNDVA